MHGDTQIETSGGERLAESLELLDDMSRDFARSLDIELTLQSALTRITDYLGAEGGALFLLEADETILHCQCCVGAANITGRNRRSQLRRLGRYQDRLYHPLDPVRAVERQGGAHRRHRADKQAGRRRPVR
jgi:hypothetical protein